ncbi:MAG: Ppx/GppA family phosphatase, partial [Cyanobacteria bacterium J06560_2]
LTQLLKMCETTELTLCDASLREGLILDYIERHPQNVSKFPVQTDLRHRQAAQLAHKYNADWESNTHIASLALQLFDQTQAIHQLGTLEKDVLEYAALLHNLGQYLSLKAYHKSSRYILKRVDPRGFTDEEMLLISQVVRYHRKSAPKSKHKKFKRLSKQQQQLVWILSGILRIAVGLDRTKDQAIATLSSQMTDEKIEISVSGKGDLEVGVWAAMSDREVLEKALNRAVSVKATP